MVPTARRTGGREIKKDIDLSRLADFDYYSSNLLYIETGEGVVPFNLENRYVQKQINEEWKKCKQANKPVRFIILKARRHGVSTLIQGRMFNECHTKSYQKGITIAADDEGCAHIHNMCHIFYDLLPEQLKPVTRYKSKKRLVFDASKDNIFKLGKKSSMQTVSCTSKAALGVGNHFIHFSEYAMYRDADKVRKAVIPTSFSTPNTFAIIESTANGMVGEGEPFYREWKKAEEGKSVFTPMFFSWLEHEEYSIPFFNDREREEILDTINDEEKELMTVLGASLEQLNWRRTQIRFIGEGADESDGLKSGLDGFHEQYPSTSDEAFIVSGNPIFNRTKLREYKLKCKDPIAVYDLNSEELKRDSAGKLKIWEFPRKGEKYVLSIDAASGEPGATDYACMEVFRVPDNDSGCVGIQCAEWHGRVEPEILGEYSIILGAFYNTALIAPEVFGYGHAVLNRLQKLDYWNIIKRTQFDAINQISKTKLGWKTDSTTKPTLLTYGRYCVNHAKVVIYSEPLIDEMMIFVRDKTGSGASAYGRGKDDRVMTFLIGIKCIELEYLGKNMTNKGVLAPNEDKPRLSTSKDPLSYDDFWDRKHTVRRHWLDQ